MSDYQPILVNENDIRSFVSPPLDNSDVSTAEILLKIEMVEMYIKRVYFRGGSPSSDARIPAILLIITHILSNATLAKKYGTLASESMGDYSYVLAPPGSNPNAIIESWQSMAIQMLKELKSPTDFEIRLTND